MKRALTFVATVLALGCSFLFYSQYLKWEFNSEGKAFDPIDGVVYTSNSFVWALIAGILFLPLVCSVYSAFFRRKKPERK
jgi:hypothetical protein